MFNKIAACMLCIMLMFSICASAETADAQPQREGVIEAERPQMQGEPPMQGRGGRMGGGRPSGMGGPPMGEMPPQMPTDENGEIIEPPPRPDSNRTGENSGELQMQTGEWSENAEQRPQVEQPERSEAMGNMNGFLNSEITSQKSTLVVLEFIKEYSTPIISVILLALAFVFVIFYKRKNY